MRRFFQGFTGDGKAVSGVGDGGKTALKMKKTTVGQGVVDFMRVVQGYSQVESQAPS